MLPNKIFRIFETVSERACQISDAVSKLYVPMRKIFILILLICLLTPFAAQAQSETEPQTGDSLSVSLPAPIPAGGYTPFSMYGITPFNYGFATWELHEGLNASLGMSVTFSPSRYAPSGVGFGQDAAFLYAKPLTKRFSVAGGVYASNMNWGFLDYRDVGIAGIAAFKVNERVSLYAYGNKSFMPKRSPLYYPLPNFCPDRIGGMINFKLSESSSISFGVEGIRY